MFNLLIANIIPQKLKYFTFIHIE